MFGCGFAGLDAFSWAFAGLGALLCAVFGRLRLVDPFVCAVFVWFVLVDAFDGVLPAELPLVLALGGRSVCIAAAFAPFPFVAGRFVLVFAVAAAGCAATTPGPLNTPGFELAAIAGCP